MLFPMFVAYAGFVAGLLLFRCTDGRRPAQSTGFALGGTILVLLFGIGLLGMLPMFALVALPLTCAAAFLDRKKSAPRFLCDLSLVGFAAALFVVLQWAPEWNKRVELKNRHPFVSLASRIPKPPERMVNASKTPITFEDERLQSIENELDYTEYRGRRAAALAAVHSGYVQQFIEAQGFGVGRMGYRRRNPERSLREETSPLIPQGQNEIRKADPSTPEPNVQDKSKEERPSSTLDRLQAQRQLHESQQLAFLDADDFGLIESADRVAGFLPHGFKQRSNHRRHWDGPPDQVARLELVSLLKHDPPAVYVSAHLPRMEMLKDVPTRPLDEFEQESLRKLEAGEETATDYKDHPTRMLGAIRAARQCLDCHQVPRGTLLGAFSYRLRVLPPPPPESEKTVRLRL